MFNGKNILITGGTGSFGKKFTQKIVDCYQPHKIVIYSRDELKQFEMQQQFGAVGQPNHVVRFLIGDVRDSERLRTVMADIDYVVHAAAMKQVPTAEHNPLECVKTNIHGAKNVIDAAIASPRVKKVIALSTDKAANPINLYGATKLVSDKLFTAANTIVGTRDVEFSVVRYGNVLGSRGSVVPLYKKLIKDGAKALPITDLRMTRFWVTLDQGVDFVLKSFARMRGGETFIPKLPSMKMTDLAKAIAPELDIDVIGIRAGEKLHETMCPADDSHLTYEYDDHFVIDSTLNFKPGVSELKNVLGECGKLVKPGFSYNSEFNDRWLKPEELLEMIDFCSPPDSAA